MSTGSTQHPLEDLVAFLDGALPDAERAQVDAHLAGCGACKDELRRLQRAAALLTRLPAQEPSPAFARAFFAEAERKGFFGRLGERLAAAFALPAVRVAAPAGALAVMLAVGLSVKARRDAARDRDIAEHLELFENYELVQSVDAVQQPGDAEVIAHLDELEDHK